LDNRHSLEVVELSANHLNLAEEAPLASQHRQEVVARLGNLHSPDLAVRFVNPHNQVLALPLATLRNLALLAYSVNPLNQALAPPLGNHHKVEVRSGSHPSILEAVHLDSLQRLARTVLSAAHQLQVVHLASHRLQRHLAHSVNQIRQTKPHHSHKQPVTLQRTRSVNQQQITEPLASLHHSLKQSSHRTEQPILSVESQQKTHPQTPQTPLPRDQSKPPVSSVDQRLKHQHHHKQNPRQRTQKRLHPIPQAI